MNACSKQPPSVPLETLIPERTNANKNDNYEL